MKAPFLFLIACTLKNRVVRRLRRLREPRYLLGLIAGLAYLYMFVVRHQITASSRSASGLAQLGPYVADITAGGAVVLWIVVVAVWLWPFPAPPWSFTAPEVQFFFTAPVRRRRLLNYKLLRSQGGVLFGLAIASFFSGAWAASSGRWSFLLGGWLFFATLQLHLKGVALTKASFKAPAARVPVLSWTAAALVVVLSGILAALFASALRSAPMLSWSVAASAVLEASQHGVAGWLLSPCAALVRPVISLTPWAFLQALGPAAMVLALNYLWVMSSDSNLEEAAAAAERRESERRAAAKPTVALPVPFSLAPRGRPETAILWKNTILLGRYFSVGLLVRVLIPVVVIAAVIGLRSGGSKAAPLVGLLVAFTALLGPYMVRNDFRHDMPRLSLLKTWPISGRQLLLGELLAPVATLSVVAWFLLAVAVALSGSWRVGPDTAAGRWAVVAAVAVVAPALIAGQVFIQNAAVVLFPGWVPTGSTRARGIEAMGQNMLMFAATLLALAIGVLPAAAVAGGLGFVLYQVVGWLSVLPAAAVLAAILAAETWLVVGWLGRILERTEPAQVETSE